MSFRIFIMALALVVTGTPALAAAGWNAQTFDIASPSDEFGPTAPPRADVTVNITGPAGVYVGDPGVYQVLVSNIGRRRADNVGLTIALPRTRTSPTVHVLGTLGARDGRCTLSGTNLVCPLGPIVAGASTPVSFTISLPQSSAPIVIGASLTTTSVEVTTANNSDSDTAHLLHPPTPVIAGDTAHVEHCTGTNLTSFFECRLYPSSISSHDIQFLTGNQLIFLNAPANYWGTWEQPGGDPQRLVLEYYDGTSHEATFDGYAVGNRCFEGVTVFHPTSIYVAPYRVCLQ